MITVACVWVQANVPYGVEYVVNLAAMVRRHLTRPHRFVCLTDRPEQVPDDITTIHIQSPAPLSGWWSKVEVFQHGRFTGRVLYLDLDTLVVSSLTPIVDYPAPFALVPHAGTFEGRDGLRVVKRFNSSVMVWDAGVPDRLWTDWRPSVATRLHGDQDWIGEQMTDAETMPIEWFPRVSQLDGQLPASDAKVVLVKKPKNAVAAQQWPWFNALWRAA